MMIAFWGGLIVVIVLLIRWPSAVGRPRSAPYPPTKTPPHIRQERFARGEIDKEDLEERRRLLSE